MIRRALAWEASFDGLLHPYRARADRIMAGLVLFLLLVCVVLAPLNDTYGAVALIGLPTCLLALWLTRSQPGSLPTRLFMGCAFMAYTGLIIHQTGGDIEGHFSAFGLIGALLYYRDWRIIVAATLFIYLHHLILGYGQTLGLPIYVFDDQQFWLLFAVHVAYFLPFIAMMCYLAIWLRREGFEGQHVIAQAGQIMQGNLLESDPLTVEEQAMPLIAAVVAMKHRLLDLLRVMPVPAAVIRIDSHSVVYVNQAWRRLFGETKENCPGFRDCLIWSQPGAWDDLLTRVQAAADRLLDKIEMILLRPDGTQLLCEVSLILHADIQPVMAILTVEDITLRRRAEQTMQRLAYRDMLTDLPNRFSLHAELDAALEDWRMMGLPFAVVLLDLDGFKPINDTHGHDAGDEVLKAIALRLDTMNRSSDMAARLGGDEFVVVLRQCDTVHQASVVAQRLIEGIAEPIALKGAECTVRIGASAGLAHIRMGATTADEILKQADEALYDAKGAGKNRVQVAQPALRAISG